jgi:NAD(P)-dependent dehydrogenase (short-subunit alcohol dehydrogenase family)
MMPKDRVAIVTGRGRPGRIGEATVASLASRIGAWRRAQGSACRAELAFEGRSIFLPSHSAACFGAKPRMALISRNSWKAKSPHSRPLPLIL